MELTKDLSLKILYNSQKERAIREKYSFTTKYRWKCLHCLKTIYFSYKQYGRNQIFCSECFKTGIKQTVVQYQYMRILKEKQTKLINSLINKEENNTNNI